MSVNCNEATLADMVAFYGDLFGLESKKRPEIPGVPGHWFGVSDQELHVVGAPPQETEIDTTGNHIVSPSRTWTRPSPNSRIKTSLTSGRSRSGHGAVWINDPAGNTIELQQDREAGAAPTR